MSSADNSTDDVFLMEPRKRTPIYTSDVFSHISSLQFDGKHETVHQFLGRTDWLMEDCEFAGIDIPEMVFVSAILCGLGGQYAQLTELVVMLDIKHTKKTLFEALLRMENMFAQRRIRDIKEKRSTADNYVVSCFYCKRVGHVRSQCHSLQKAKANKKQKRNEVTDDEVTDDVLGYLGEY